MNMTAANPVLYTIPTGAAGSSSLPKALKDAHSWPRFWSEIQSCGPIGAIRWRIREDPHGALTVVDLASEELPALVDLADRHVGLQASWLAEPGTIS